MTLSVILDTDIGGDVDDLLALAVLLASPEIDLHAVTCVYGDVQTRARIALKTLALKGRSGVRVAAGAERALNAERPLLCGKDDGQGLLTTADAALRAAGIHGSELIIETVMRNAGEIHLAAIGPLTNLALALLNEPRVAENVASITVMGGVVGGAGRLELPWVDYNFACDPEAAKIVLASGAPISIVPIDVTMQVHIYASDVAGLRAAGDPYHLALADQVRALSSIPGLKLDLSSRSVGRSHSGSARTCDVDASPRSGRDRRRILGGQADPAGSEQRVTRECQNRTGRGCGGRP